jgi:large subunit ribosomal protein L21
VPKPDRSLSAVVVSGGRQYRVVPGERILVDRIAAEPGTSVTLGRVLLLSDGDEVKVGLALHGVNVDAKVIGHTRGPRIESIHFKPKKRVRVHSGGRAHLTTLEIIGVAGVGLEAEEEQEVAETAKPKRRLRAASQRKAAPKAELRETVGAPKKTSRASKQGQKR